MGLKEITVDGFRVKFAKEWDIIPDKDPSAFSILVCPECLASFVGKGKTLKESMASAEELNQAHKCSHLQGA